MARRFGFLFVFFLVLHSDNTRIFPNPGFSAQPTARRAPGRIQNEIIVRFKATTNEYHKFLTHSGVGGSRMKAYRILKGLERIRIPRNLSVADAIQMYQQNPDVLYAEPNYIVSTTVTTNDPRFSDLWGLHNTGLNGGTPDADIDAPQAWDITTGGNSVVIGVIDSGIDYNHQDLSSNMFQNSADCNNNGVDDDGNGYIDDCYGIDTRNDDSDPMDDNNHGTHVAGTIGAVGNNNIGVVGVNWDAQLMGCKFVNSSGSGTVADAIECLEYFGDLKDRWIASNGTAGANIFATNNSWGGGGFSQALMDAIDAHRQKGILFIAAAGNGDPFFGFPINNDENPFYPCSYYLPNIICVAATTRTDERSSFSNYGRRTVHVGAPGSQIVSTIRNHNYGTSSGTSMATPHVTGVAALVKSADAALDWRSIKNLILAGGDDLDTLTNTVAQKRLNAHGALTCNNSMVFSRLTPINDTISGVVGEPIPFSALNINCDNPNGDVVITVIPSNETITLVDDGSGIDISSGDGIYEGQWTPVTEGMFTVTFPAGDEVTVGVGNPQLSVTPSTVPAGGTVTASWSGVAFPSNTDWIGLYLQGAPHGSNNPSVAWRYTTGAANGSVPVGVPTTAAPGTYELRLFANDGYTLLATSGPLTVTAAASPTLSVNPTSVAAGGTVTATWSNVASPTTKDWIGLYLQGAPHGSNNPSVAWRYTTGAANGSVPVGVPTTAAPGTYELRLFANDRYTLLAKSNLFNVIPP